MRLPNSLMIPAVFVGAALLALLAAVTSVGVIERSSVSSVTSALMLQGEDWAQVETDGLQVILTGTAPSESDRFRALAIAGGEVDSARVIDRMEVPISEAIRAPRFSVEILRNDAGISMIGLIPAATDREALERRVSAIGGGLDVADFLESADYPVPDGWADALDFALFALEELPRSKISMDSRRVEIEAIADSAEQKDGWEAALRRRVPGGLRTVMNISAPRPVITPFTARFVVDESGPRFDACAAGTESGMRQITAAGTRAGIEGEINCTIGLGEPSPDWARAVTLGVAAMSELGGGTITFSDADVTLVAAADVEQASFDRIAGELEADLPEVFSLHASKTPSTDGAAEGPPEFTATLSEEGEVQLRGRLQDQQERQITESVARARFGIDNVYSATRLDPTLPQGWSVRVLSAVEALSLLENGVAIVQPGLVELRGETGDPNANAEISRLLSDKLGEAQDFRVNVTYNEALDPVAQMPTPEECVAQINDILLESKITFAPGSVEIEARSANTIDRIADIVRNCPDAPMEIGGHTDSQGSEELNKALSQQRANSVLNALLGRRVLTSNLTAHGYGEEQPIADNDTEEGREENRRIEFKLVGTTELPDFDEDGNMIPGTGDPIVVDPDLADFRPRPRPGSETTEAAASEDDAAAEDEVADDATDAEPMEDAAATEEGSGDEPPMDAAAEEEGSGDEPPADDAAETEESDADAENTDAVADAEATDESETDTEAPVADDAPDATPDEATDADVTEAEATDATDDTATEPSEADADAAITEETALDDAATEDTVETDSAAEADPTPADADEDNGDTTTSDEPVDPPLVVNPELEGVRPPPRPE